MKMIELRPNNPELQNARGAEQRLHVFYNLTPKEHEIWMESIGTMVRVLEYGDSSLPPILLVPGNSGDGFPLIPLIAQLPEQHILLLNRPGGGLSGGIDHKKIDFRTLANDTILLVLRHFEIERLSIIAHSMGGHWSLWFSMDHPKRVQKLVLLGVCGNVLGCRPPLALRLTAVPGLNKLLFRAITKKSGAPSLSSLSFLGHSAETLAQLPQELAQCYAAFQKLPNAEISSLSLMEMTNTIFGSKRNIRICKEELSRLSLPVLMIWGESDPFGTIAKGKQIQEALHAAFKIVPTGGHLPWLDDLPFCGREITDFLK
jgi:pimeloyl-ACP methyl ester carboxylesterase